MSRIPNLEYSMPSSHSVMGFVYGPVQMVSNPSSLCVRIVSKLSVFRKDLE